VPHLYIPLAKIAARSSDSSTLHPNATLHSYSPLSTAKTLDSDSCGYPILFRGVQSTSTTPQWRVVGSALIPDLMHGETIYGREMLNRCTAVHKNSYGGDLTNLIDGFAFAFYDTTDSILLDDPGTILERAGITVQRYQRWPHRLAVSPESLRIAAVLLEEFVII
jgi:hypothetical protein